MMTNDEELAKLHSDLGKAYSTIIAERYQRGIMARQIASLEKQADDRAQQNIQDNILLDLAAVLRNHGFRVTR